jgi:hypothetical protein
MPRLNALQNRKSFITLIVVALGIAGAAAVLWARRDSGSGVKTIVTNSGSGPMRDVRLVVTGGTFPLGDLAANQTRAVRVKPTGESHIVLTYVDPSGLSQRLSVGCYFEPRYSGEIALDVADNKVIRVDDRIGLRRY